MTRDLLIAAGIAVGGQVLYHTVARSIGSEQPPLLIVFVAYATSMSVVGVFWLLAGNARIELSTVTDDAVIKAILLGLAVTCVEVGFVLAYRKGLPLNTGAVSTLAVASLALIPIGYFFFDEAFRLRSAAGALATVAGLWLMLGGD